MSKQIRLGIVGATGYVGLEMVRLLAGRQDIRLSTLVSRSFAGQLFSDVYPAFCKIVDLPLQALDPAQLAADCDIVVTALPHGTSGQVVPGLLDLGLRVLDHSGDFRYKDQAVYEKDYKIKHPRPSLLQESVYGLPELYRAKIKAARLVANPGCYPTCSLLALKPLLAEKLVNPASLIIDAVSGVSGAGRKADVNFSFTETAEGFKAYGVTGHRHTSEIEQECARLAGLDQPLPISFTPHLAPLKRGMLATVYADLATGAGQEQLQAAYKKHYAAEWFVRLLPEGSLPDTRFVAGTNFADISVHHDTRTGRVKVLCAIDNLGKGAAAQAVQSLNLMAGLPENIGLYLPGLAV